MTRDFWKSAGMHLTDIGPQGWLSVTPDFLRAYYTRPEMHPIDGSCAVEIAIHDALMADPFKAVDEARLAAIADDDAAGNYRAVLAFRDLLAQAGSIEGAYLKLISSPDSRVPPVFVDQMVHLIVRNILKDAHDPIRLRAGEIFFREQSVSTGDDRLMLADEEIVDMKARGIGETGLGQLLAASDVPMKKVELDVLVEDNKDIYWERSDRFDTVVDFRYAQPALDAFARVIEGWLGHLAKLDCAVQPLMKIEDGDWRWHIGLDREATRILNMLYEGAAPPLEDMARIVALFEMRIKDEARIIDRVKGMPVYLGLAMSKNGRLKMKPQNLLMNLPLVAAC